MQPGKPDLPTPVLPLLTLTLTLSADNFLAHFEGKVASEFLDSSSGANNLVCILSSR